jgi:hypothetical protein
MVVKFGYSGEKSPAALRQGARPFVLEALDSLQSDFLIEHLRVKENVLLSMRQPVRWTPRRELGF